MHIDKLLLTQIGPFENETFEFSRDLKPNAASVHLLTGPNGSGKSTALYALAGAIAAGRLGQTGEELLRKRAYSPSSQVVIAVEDGVSLRKNEKNNAGETNDPFCPDKTIPQISNSGIPGLDAYASLNSLLSRYAKDAQHFIADIPSGVQSKFSWAAFAYAGQRPLDNFDVRAIQEPQNNPFENSLSFTNATDSSILANWIAAQKYKQLKAKDSGNADRAAQFEKSITSIEKVISEITGDDFAFDTSGDDLNVRVRRNGVTVSLDVLPDGLKSIVSWIADLLMRLDRIPWINNTPVLERNFLLLLDEIDIHLHPTWQRNVLPIVQKMFPKAQIIASTHSPFVVASVEDAQVIALQLDENGHATIESTSTTKLGVSYSSILRSIFGIKSDFDIETENLFKEFHKEKQNLLSGETSDDTKIKSIADQLANRGEEVAALIGIELRQLERQRSIKK
jgi:predicted ATP-binding protein involved in virulence